MLICIEGIDGSGKGTVTAKLLEKINSAEEDLVCGKFSFPNYTGTAYGEIVGKYLNGDFGPKAHPYISGTLFSLDRAQSKPILEAMLSACDCLILDRYTPSNVAYCAAGCKSAEEGLTVADHFLSFEHNFLELPLPDKIFYLDMDTKIAVENIAKKKARDYTSLTHDIHEADFTYLDSVNNFYKHTLPSLYAKLDVPVINIACVEAGELRSFDCIVTDIVNQIWS